MNYYEPSNMEYRVSCIYTEHGIFEPHDLEIHNVAMKLNIKLVYSDHRSYAYEDEQIRIINIKNGLPREKQREVFYHELCHLLRHAGDQTRTYASRFIEKQEAEAARFVLYASIPCHMIN